MEIKSASRSATFVGSLRNRRRISTCRILICRAALSIVSFVPCVILWAMSHQGAQMRRADSITALVLVRFGKSHRVDVRAAHLQQAPQRRVVLAQPRVAGHLPAEIQRWPCRHCLVVHATEDWCRIYDCGKKRGAVLIIIGAPAGFGEQLMPAWLALLFVRCNGCSRGDREA